MNNLHNANTIHAQAQRTSPSQPSILKSLRSLSPVRACTLDEALGLAERQAGRLNQLLATSSVGWQITGITTEHIAGLPRIRVVYEQLPVSGMSHWNGREWMICLNTSDPEPRQRFTLLHEFKHIIDHGQVPRLYTGQAATRHTKGSKPSVQPITSPVVPSFPAPPSNTPGATASNACQSWLNTSASVRQPSECALTKQVSAVSETVIQT